MSFILSMTQANNPNKYYKGHRSGRIAKTLKKKYWKLNYIAMQRHKKSRVEVHQEASKTLHRSSAVLR